MIAYSRCQAGRRWGPSSQEPRLSTETGRCYTRPPVPEFKLGPCEVRGHTGICDSVFRYHCLGEEVKWHQEKHPFSQVGVVIGAGTCCPL